MPIYVFSHPKTGQVKEIFLPMNGPITYSEGGVIWTREYAFNVAVKDSPVNPWKQNDYMRKTQEMRGNLGDVMDLSRELSEKRAQDNGGVDPVKQTYFKEYSQKRGGRKHWEDI